MRKPTRRPISAAMVGAASAVLLMTSAGAAQATASAAAVPNITVDEVSRLMPADKSLPGKVHLQVKLVSYGTSEESPCPESFFTLTSRSSQVLAVYEAGTAAQFLVKPVGWALVTTVFHSAAKARVAAAELMKAEKSCPRQSVPDGSGGPFGSDPTVTRSYGTPYTVGAWTGYRSIDHVAAGDPSNGDNAVPVRLIDIYLTHGNLLLHVEEIGTDGATSGPRQELWRQSVTRLLVSGLNRQAAHPGD